MTEPLTPERLSKWEKEWASFTDVYMTFAEKHALLQAARERDELRSDVVGWRHTLDCTARENESLREELKALAEAADLVSKLAPGYGLDSHRMVIACRAALARPGVVEVLHG